jgi:hypothetical protein
VVGLLPSLAPLSGIKGEIDMRKKEKLFTAGEEEKERERGIFSVSEFIDL